MENSTDDRPIDEPEADLPEASPAPQPESPPLHEIHPAEQLKALLSTPSEDAPDPYAETDPGFFNRATPTEEPEKGAIILVHNGDSKVAHSLEEETPAEDTSDEHADPTEDVRQTNKLTPIEPEKDEPATPPQDDLRLVEEQELDNTDPIETPDPLSVNDVENLPDDAKQDQQDENAEVEELFQDSFQDFFDNPRNTFLQPEIEYELTDDNYQQRVSVPFEVTVSEEDLKVGLRKSNCTQAQKDATFPLPTHQHIPGVVDRRHFPVSPPKPTLPLAWIIAGLLTLAALLVWAVSFVSP